MSFVPRFTDGLATQLDEVKALGERAIRQDLLVREHRLSDRQALALERVLELGRLTINEFEALCRGAKRRTLQRDLKALVGKGLVEWGVGPTIRPGTTGSRRGCSVLRPGCDTL